MKAWHVTRKYWLEAIALLGAAVLASTLLVGPALGQGQGSAPCSPSVPPGSPGTATTGVGEPHNPAPAPDNLSGRLAQSDGVICPPPAVDPGMKLPTPETGSDMPVISPPGSPGGDPSVRPK